MWCLYALAYYYALTIVMYNIFHLLLNLGKSILMSHFMPQIFITKMRNEDFQSPLQWLEFVVYTRNSVKYF